MLKIRLARIGRRNDPTFRVVVTEKTNSPKTGRHVEVLGNHNPKLKSTTLNGERVKHWISKGAQISDTVHNLLITQGIIEGKKINVLPKKSPIVKEEAQTTEGATEASEAGASSPEQVAETPAEQAKSEDTATEESTGEASPEDEQATEAPTTEETPEEKSEEKSVEKLEEEASAGEAVAEEVPEEEGEKKE